MSLRHTHRAPGHELGGEKTLPNITTFMAMHPSPVPPIEVSCIQSLFVNFVLALIFAQFHERNKKHLHF